MNAILIAIDPKSPTGGDFARSSRSIPIFLRAGLNDRRDRRRPGTRARWKGLSEDDTALLRHYSRPRRSGRERAPARLNMKSNHRPATIPDGVAGGGVRRRRRVRGLLRRLRSMTRISRVPKSSPTRHSKASPRDLVSKARRRSMSPPAAAEEEPRFVRGAASGKGRAKLRPRRTWARNVPARGLPAPADFENERAPPTGGRAPW